MRIDRHPILGELESVREVVIDYEGERVASALVAHGVKVFRETVKRGEGRGYFCGIGRCTDCVMIVDGVPNVRTCITAVRDGMRVRRQVGLGSWER